VIENDWLEAIVALPGNIFYNTGIATYIWVITNRKPPSRSGRVQLIDATGFSQPLPRNLGQKNCQLSDADISTITDAFSSFAETAHSKIFPAAAFGYNRIVVHRALELHGVDPQRAYAVAEVRALIADQSPDATEPLRPVIRKIHPSGTAADPVRGLFETIVGEVSRIVEYEPDPERKDYERVPLLEAEGIEGFMSREVLPFAPLSWYEPQSVRIGYELSFARHFYRPLEMRSPDEIRAEILSLEAESERLVVRLLDEAL
jgi:type I restriction enzyme M protein